MELPSPPTGRFENEPQNGSFSNRREMGVINIGGDGIIVIDGKEYRVNYKEGMYIGMGILWHIKIQIYFHPAVMRVARHRIPYGTRHQLCHTHHKLAAFDLSRQDILADNAVV